MMKFLCVLFFLFYGLLPVFAQNNDGIISNKTDKVIINRKKIKVYVVLPTTGRFGDVGKKLAKSLLVTRSLIQNPKYDRLFGENYEFDIRLENDKCNADLARQVAKKIVSEKDVMFVIGHYCSKGSLAAAPIYNKAGIIQITPFSTQATLTEKGYKTFFRIAGRTDRYGDMAAELLHELKAYKKLALIHDNDITYGQTLVDKVILGLNLRDKLTSDTTNKEFQFYYKTPINLNNYKNNINKLIDILERDKIKIVYFGGYYLNLLPIIKGAKKRNLNIQFVTGSSAQNYDFWVQSKGLAEGTIFTFSKDYTRDISSQEENKAQQAINFKKYEKEYDFEAAVRKYGLQASRNIFERNRPYKNRVLFIQSYFDKNKHFPSAYMINMYASFEILKQIITHSEFKNRIKKLSNKKLNDIEFREFGYDIADFMKNKGFNISEEVVGFATVIGPINFSITGEWDNCEYVFYQWVNKKQNRQWLSNDASKEFIGDTGDFVRLFKLDTH